VIVSGSNVNQGNAAKGIFGFTPHCLWLAAKFLITPKVTTAMDTIKPRVQEHDVLILREGKEHSICTCDGNLLQMDGKSTVPTCARCGGRILRLS